MPDPGVSASLIGVSKSFPEGLPGRLSLRPRRRRQVLSGFSLDLRAGSCTAVTGPNGCGKTTILKLVAGLLLPDAGRVEVMGLDPVRDHRRTAALTGISLSGERSFYWRLCVRHNLEYFGALAGKGGAALRRRISEVSDLLGLPGDPGIPVEALSAGMRQRLSLARALLAGPRVLLLDEPFRSLDEESRRRVSEEIGRLRAAGAAIALATPVPSEASGLADRIEVVPGSHNPPPEAAGAAD